MRVEAYAALHPGEADVAGLPILVGIAFTEQLLALKVADTTAALRWSDAGLFQRPRDGLRQPSIDALRWRSMASAPGFGSLDQDRNDIGMASLFRVVA